MAWNFQHTMGQIFGQNSGGGGSKGDFRRTQAQPTAEQQAAQLQASFDAAKTQPLPAGYKVGGLWPAATNVAAAQPRKAPPPFLTNPSGGGGGSSAGSYT